MRLTVVTYLWFDPDNHHNKDYVYTPSDVFLVKRMIDRHLSLPHDFVVFTDQPTAFEGSDVRALPLDSGCHVPGKIFAKLIAWHPRLGEMVGADRVLALDLDCAAVGSLDEIVDRPEDLVLWRNPARVPWDHPISAKGRRRDFYNLSMILMTPGARRDIWDEFQSRHAGYRHDQGYVCSIIGGDQSYWDQSHGVYRLERMGEPGTGIAGDLPENARIVFFPGDKHKPWRPDIQERFPWIRQHRY